MNIETGEIKEFKGDEEIQAALSSGNWIELNGRPKASCRKCYGRGYIGRNDAGKYIVCSCVRPIK